MGREDEIRSIAYTIWQEEGCCDGRDIEHWYRAEVIWEERQAQKNASEVAIGSTDTATVVKAKSKTKKTSKK